MASSDDSQAKSITHVVTCAIISSFGCLLFGYNLGISGGVILMNDFLVKFFPQVHKTKQLCRNEDGCHCNYNNQLLQLFTSSLFMAAAFSSVMALIFYKRLGRKRTMRVAALFFVVGIVLETSAMNLLMLILGRTCLGAGVGFTNQVVPLFISPTKYNRVRMHLIAMNVLITLGILIANFVNVYTFARLQPNGWRVSLGGSAIPAFFILIGSIFIADDDDTLLQKQASCLEIVNLIMKKRSSWPHLFCGTMIQVFKQFAGITVIVLYCPVISDTIIGLAFGGYASLNLAVIVGGMNAVSTLVGALLVYKLETRFILIFGSYIMLMAQIGGSYARYTNRGVHEPALRFALSSLNLFATAFSWSWGTLGWLITFKTFQAVEDETTCSVMSLIAVVTNFICASIVAQTSLTMWCHAKDWLLFFCLAWIAWTVIMTLFTCNDYLPAVKGITELDTNPGVWRKHGYWNKFHDQVYNAKKPPRGFKMKRNNKKKRN